MGKKRKGDSSSELYSRKRQYEHSSSSLALDYDDNNNDDDGNKVITAGPLDPEVGQRAAFPEVDMMNAGPITGPPLNVEDYLSSVRREASERPSFVVSRKDKLARDPVVPKGRGKLRSYDEDNNGRGTNGSRKEVPAKNTTSCGVVIDRAWRNAFMEQFKRTKGEISKIDKNTDVNIELPQTFSKWRQFILAPENRPRVSLLKRLDHELVMRLIGYCHKWVSSKMAPELAQWIYSLLVILPDEIMVGEDISVLRQLAKKCIQVKSNPHWQLDAVTAYTLDLVVTVVTEEYKQLDLLGEEVLY